MSKKKKDKEYPIYIDGKWIWITNKQAKKVCKKLGI